jgi:hypothetical protein
MQPISVSLLSTTPPSSAPLLAPSYSSENAPGYAATSSASSSLASSVPFASAAMLPPPHYAPPVFHPASSSSLPPSSSLSLLPAYSISSLPAAPLQHSSIQLQPSDLPPPPSGMGSVCISDCDSPCSSIAIFFPVIGPSFFFRNYFMIQIGLGLPSVPQHAPGSQPQVCNRCH